MTALPAGSRIGPYHVLEKLGEGGMGEVYRATDTKLKRDVAIKVLPAAVTTEPDRLARFQREAEVLASLNHPNIAHLHGLEDAGDVRALVMELVEGPTLADRIAGGPVPIHEALVIARQIASALDAAHEQRVVHRDLKPSNIKVRPDGTVKVLDFGLAKLDEPANPEAAHTAADTVSLTREGTVMGTAAYMSPEQARGQVVDKRTDIWAFGCVLYEMLTGRAAFARETTSDTIVAILEREPDWAMLPSATPLAVDRLLRLCLQKDPRRRCRDIGHVLFDLEDGSIRPGDDVKSRKQSIAASLPWRALALAAIVVAVIAATFAWRASRGVQRATPLPTRTTVTLGAGQELDTRASSASLALSSDGRRIAYVAVSDGRTQLFVRDLVAFEARRLEGTEGAQFPFFSPDARDLAFFADGKLKRVSIGEGAPVTLCDVPSIGRGGTWGADGTIVFSSASGLMRVSSDGGTPAPVKTQDPEMDRRVHRWPHFLPDGKTLLSSVESGVSGAVFALSLDTGQWRMLVRGTQAQYINPGYLVYHAAHVKEGQLNAVAFDVNALALRGTPFPVLNDVFRGAAGGAAYYAASETGTVIFAPGGFARSLVQVDRQGRRTPIVSERAGFRFPRFSPDGRRVAVTVDPRPSQVWVYDLERASRVPLTNDNNNLVPTWTPDGQHVVFGNGLGVIRVAADGSGRPEMMIKQPPGTSNLAATSWSADGQSFILEQQTQATDMDIWLVPKNGEPQPLVATPAKEYEPRLSPDGRWLAYSSNESRREEVYVRPFPDINARRWMVSVTGGRTPVWSFDGRELFYMNGPAVYAVDVDVHGRDFVSSKPQLLFEGPFDTTQSQNFDVSRDGRFVMVEADPNAKPTKIDIILNWADELTRLATGARQ